MQGELVWAWGDGLRGRLCSTCCSQFPCRERPALCPDGAALAGGSGSASAFAGCPRARGAAAGEPRTARPRTRRARWVPVPHGLRSLPSFLLRSVPDSAPLPAQVHHLLGDASVSPRSSYSACAGQVGSSLPVVPAAVPSPWGGRLSRELLGEPERSWGLRLQT